MEIKYGMISDIHEDPKIIIPALQALKKNGAEKLLVNGDIGGRMGSLEESQNYTAFILNEIGKSGLEAYVQPGSHETLEGFHHVLNSLAKHYPNIKSVFDNRRVEQEDHDLVFIPGSDFLCGGQYRIGNEKETITGLYDTENGPLHYESMNDLKENVRDPKNTIVVCHVPRKFNNLETCVDMAEFGEVNKMFLADIVYYKDGEKQIRIFYNNGESDTILKSKSVETFTRNQQFWKGSILPADTAIPFVEAGAPITLKKENRGNKDLGDIYNELGITKAVSGHFHESSHRANDSNGNHVKEGEHVTDLFWNSGHLDRGYTGILTVDGEKVSYQNIRLEGYS